GGSPEGRRRPLGRGAGTLHRGRGHRAGGPHHALHRVRPLQRDRGARSELARSRWCTTSRSSAGASVEHARYYGALRRIQGWTRELLYERGPVAEARRARAPPLLAKEPERPLDYGDRG